MTHTIQKANSNDYTKITEIWEASIRATHHFLSEQNIEFYKSRIPSIYLPQLSLFYIKVDETIAGFIGLSDDKIEMLFVHPEFFGSGIGKTLTNFAIHEMGIRKVDANEQNPKATDFYKSLGFKVKNRSELDGDGNPFPVLYLEL